jgi:rubrerythrin
MHEEEKLARDVYTALNTTWNVPTFQNIATSEQAHMDEIELLLSRYNLAIPTQTPGVFSDANLQSLYTTLIAQGSQSVADALKVGGAIEEIDILDLQSRLTQTDNADITQAFNNLMNGSYNHLKAFSTALLNQTGETYVPQYHSAEAYQSILSGSTGNGNSNGGQGNGNQGGQNGNSGTGTGAPQVQAQANIAAASTIHGTVSAYNYGTLTIQADEGQVVGVQLGKQNYVNSLGFAPQVGETVTVYGFPGDQGLFSAITVTVDSTGQTYTFRDSTGRPAWAGGNDKGGGSHYALWFITKQPR